MDDKDLIDMITRVRKIIEDQGKFSLKTFSLIVSLQVQIEKEINI